MSQCCETCRWWEIQTISHGACEHPTTAFMRHVVIKKVVPFAFKELEVTYTLRGGGVECPAYEVRP